MAYLLKFLDIFRWKKHYGREWVGNTENIYGFYKRKDKQDHE